MENTDFEKTINHNLTKILQLDNITDNSKNKHIRLAVALSGGSDSLTLTIALHQLNYDVLAILVNHNLRVEAKKEIQQIMLFGVNKICCFYVHGVKEITEQLE